ncbi:MAG: hypothetical protein ACUVXF_09915 [Desulfobaccales bacterium]
MEKTMGRLLSRLWVLVVVLMVLGACGPRLRPGVATGAEWRPGQYVQESSVAPDFNPEEASYSLTLFPVEQASGTSAGTFQNLFQEELLRAWRAQGLKVERGKDAVRLSGAIHYLSLRGTRLRWLTGRVHACLTISGVLTREDQVLFAFRDQVALASPLAPGRASPKEQELLLRRLAREAVQHILNELLLHRRPSAS